MAGVVGQPPVSPRPAPSAPDGDPPNQEEYSELRDLFRDSPPWLVSTVVHMLAMILLALFYVTTRDRPSIELEAVYGEKLGDQLLDDSLNLSTDKPDLLEDKAIFSPSELPAVDDPLAAPPSTELLTSKANLATSSVEAPIGLALTGREKGMKNVLLAQYGGNATTQESVRQALEWLKRNQQSGGLWSLQGPYADGGSDENLVAATAMALLAFQGDGHTHREGEYQKVVKKAWDALRKSQNSEGQFVGSTISIQHQLYTHAQATIAICELYGMTEDSTYRSMAERAVQYCVKAQDKQEGGWRYNPGSDSDTSVTGWFVMALQSAKMAKLDVPSETLRNASRFLDSVQADEEGAKYFYQPGRAFTMAVSAEALLCRQYLGWRRDDPRLIAGAEFLTANPINLNAADVYYWYYATQMLHHMEGDYWKRWNEVMRQVVPESQVKKGNERGSWDPQNDRWGPQGGRLFVTCLHTYMLEVYYRHLPLYTNIYRR